MNDHTVDNWPELAQRAKADITIVGLGSGELEDISLGGWRALCSAAQLWLRTQRHPCVAQLAQCVAFQTFDSLYEQYEQFDDVYHAISERVIALGREAGGVTYAVPGHPWVGEATTRLIVDAAKAANLQVDVIGAASFVPASMAAVGVDVLKGSQIIDAMVLAKKHHPVVEVSLPLLVGQVYARWLASDVKLALLNAYPDSHAVYVVQAAGTRQQLVQHVLLRELDHLTLFDHMTSLYVPPLAEHSSPSELHELIAHLRAPEGCPWDQEQSLDSLRQDLLGECMEVLEAIDMEQSDVDNSEHIAEELGDLFAVATMLVQIATEEGRFRMADVVHHIVTKLIRRHPHVFGQETVDDVGQVLTNWDEIKAAEKAEKGLTTIHPLDGVPAHLPALEKARKLQAKAAKAGLLDRDELENTQTTIQAVVQSMASGGLTEATMGELLWRLVALADKHDVNAEDALRTYSVAFRNAHNEVVQ